MLKNINKLEFSASDRVLKYTDISSLSFEIEEFISNPQLKNLYIYNPVYVEKILNEIILLYQLVEAAGGLVRNEKYELLFIFRRGKWDLPKGKVEAGENLMEGAIREVEEETGLKNIQIIREIGTSYHTYEQQSHKILKKTTWYEMKCKSRRKLIPQSNEDITEVKWINQTELGEVIANTYPSIVELLLKAGFL